MFRMPRAISNLILDAVSDYLLFPMHNVRYARRLRHDLPMCIIHGGRDELFDWRDALLVSCGHFETRRGSGRWNDGVSSAFHVLPRATHLNIMSDLDLGADRLVRQFVKNATMPRAIDDFDARQRGQAPGLAIV
ncbi:hypothetical protein CYMTET_14286 [Cymbomonas tetramitiformis]|uniref:Uncharacterized protein n=1 Tax=Cymbomonas tetramitiformis TaxID=36881 RepID=A0AAE0EVG7_9CHLO|nr:hypothetical protein CYMTET_49762 [Cymbomonas tetramitiformis]KAK3243194.1 hypothetical protein CYMTET_47150 [Cymbomonas tetramitiformis]KAK3277703.1 hypothetical protein CYMTET_14286 [Cymbomonas tetramitiformis]